MEGFFFVAIVALAGVSACGNGGGQSQGIISTLLLTSGK
jgi:hypothetical protein